jgi:CHAD domain-containing protein
MTTEMRETEQKYEAEIGVVLPSLEELPQVATVSEPEAETLIAEYYDTNDLRLFKGGVTLWRREGGTDEGWHLKLPDGAEGTTERMRTGGAHDPVPEELARLVQVHARGASLGPVARIETRRSRTTLRDAAGTSLAEIASDEVAAQSMGASTILSRWNEIEVELTGGSPRLLRATAKRFRHSGLRPAARAADLERALGAAAWPPATPPHPAYPGGRNGMTEADRRLTPRSSAGAVVLAYLNAQAGRLKALDPAVRRDEPDAIHQMRVTTRRLRATFQAFPMVVPEPTTTHLREELRWLGHLLGDARDVEVLDQHFHAELASTPVELVIGPAKARVTAHFASREAAARNALLEALDSQRYFGLLDDLDRLLDELAQAAPTTEPADETLPRAVAHAYRRAEHRMHGARRAPAGPARDVALHEARKAAKRARYAAEAVQPAFGKEARRFAKQMKAVQSVLGDHQDAVTARAVAREIGISAHLAGENAFSFGLLNERAHRDALEYQRQARSVWRRATRHKARL